MTSRTNKMSSLIEPQIKDLPTMHFKSRALLQYDNSNNIEYNFDLPFKVKSFNVNKHFEQNRKHFKTHTKPTKKTLLMKRAPNKNNHILESGYLNDEEKLFPSIDSDCEETFNKTDVNRYAYIKIVHGPVKDLKHCL